MDFVWLRCMFDYYEMLLVESHRCAYGGLVISHDVVMMDDYESRGDSW